VTVAIRNILMRGVMESIDSSIGGLDEGMFTETIRNSFSFSARMFDSSISMKGSITYIIAITAVSIAVMTIAYSKTYRRK
jgi:multidrug/hemolysin transport system permease protein